MDRQAENLIELLRCLATGETPRLTELQFSAVSCLAYQQGISNLLYPMFRLLPKERQPEKTVLSDCKQTAFTAATRSELHNKELDAICAALSAQSIYALPLKGAVIKYLYTKPEYRSMSDIDLLLPKEEKPRIRQIMEQLGFRMESNTDGTDVFVSSFGLQYELHYDLTEDAPTAECVPFLASFLDRAKQENDRLVLSPEEQYVYVLAHMAKHLQTGGSGIRQVMDVWVCRHRQELDADALSDLLEQTNLRQFAAVAETLADAWFSGAQSSPPAEQLGDYILSGKLFGTDRQRTENRMMKASGSRVTYWLRRIFPPYRVMTEYFPLLKKAPILLPFFWIVRFFRGLFFGRDRLRAEYDTVRTIDENDLSAKEALFAQCGLIARPNEEVAEK